MPNPLQTALAPPWRGVQPWLIQAIFQAAFYKHLLALSLEYFSQSNVSQQSQNRSHNGTGNCLIAKLISQRRSEGNIQITFGRLLRLFLIPGAFDCFGGNCPATYNTSVQMNKPREEISSEKISKFLKKIEPWAGAAPPGVPIGRARGMWHQLPQGRGSSLVTQAAQANITAAYKWI